MKIKYGNVGKCSLAVALNKSHLLLLFVTFLLLLPLFCSVWKDRHEWASFLRSSIMMYLGEVKFIYYVIAVKAISFSLTCISFLLKTRTKNSVMLLQKSFHLKVLLNSTTLSRLIENTLIWMLCMLTSAMAGHDIAFNGKRCLVLCWWKRLENNLKGEKEQDDIERQPKHLSKLIRRGKN